MAFFSMPQPNAAEGVLVDELREKGALRHNALRAITDALIRSGYKSLDAQARALGICRSTAWTVIKQKHKLGRLHDNTTTKILANPELPVQVRAAVEAYVGAVKLGSLASGAKLSERTGVSARGATAHAE